MKKLLSIALCATAVSAFAAGESSAQTVLGEVGVTAITTSLSNAIVAVSYDDLAGDAGMVYSNLVKTTNLTVDDKLIQFSYDESAQGKYTSWVLKERTPGGAKYWEGQTEAYKGDTGLDVILTPPTADMVRGAVGTGIWLVRQHPENGAFYIYGKPATSMTSTTVAGKWTLIGNPTQAEKKIGTSATSDTVMVEKPTTGDQIVIPMPSDGRLCYYTFKEGKGWRTTDAEGKWVETPPTLGAGLGCWILTAEKTTINW